MPTWVKTKSGILVNLDRYSMINIWPPASTAADRAGGTTTKPFRVVAFNAGNDSDGTIAREEVVLFDGSKGECESVYANLQQKLQGTDVHSTATGFNF